MSNSVQTTIFELISGILGMAGIEFTRLGCPSCDDKWGLVFSLLTPEQMFLLEQEIGYPLFRNKIDQYGRGWKNLMAERCEHDNKAVVKAIVKVLTQDPMSPTERIEFFRARLENSIS